MEALGEEWIAAAGEALAAVHDPGAPDRTLDYVVSGAAAGRTVVGVRVSDGRITLQSGSIGDPDVTVTVTWPTARAILEGSLSSDAAYMNGSMKVEGAHKAWLLDLRRLRDAARAALAPVLSDTDD